MYNIFSWHSSVRVTPTICVHSQLNVCNAHVSSTPGKVFNIHRMTSTCCAYLSQFTPLCPCTACPYTPNCTYCHFLPRTCFTAIPTVSTTYQCTQLLFHCQGVACTSLPRITCTAHFLLCTYLPHFPCSVIFHCILSSRTRYHVSVYATLLVL